MYFLGSSFIASKGLEEADKSGFSVCASGAVRANQVRHVETSAWDRSTAVFGVGCKQCCGIKAFIPTSVIQGNLPLYTGGWTLGSPFGCITEVIISQISVQTTTPWSLKMLILRANNWWFRSLGKDGLKARLFCLVPKGTTQSWQLKHLGVSFLVPFLGGFSRETTEHPGLVFPFQEKHPGT